MAENLTAALHSTRGKGLQGAINRGRIHLIGRPLNWTLGTAANAADRGLAAGAKAIFRPGQEGGLAHSAAKGVGEVYNVLKGAPPVAKLVAGAVPAALLLREQAADQLTPLVNEAVQEGRQVLANDQSFIEKKASLEARILEKSASVKSAAGIGDFLNALGTGMGSDGLKSLGGGLSGLGTLRAPGPAAPMSAYAGPVGQLLGGGGSVLGGIGNMVGNTAKTLGGGNNNQTSGVMDTAKYQLNRRVNPLMDRVRADESFASNFFSSLGSETAKSMVGLLKDMAGKAVSRMSQMPAQHSMIENLQQGDPMLAKADAETLSNAYHTMSNFAPTLSTDENAVRSFLREAVMAGSGPDYATIANLAKAESTIRDTRKFGSAQGIEINLEKLINPEAAAKLRTVGLNKVAAAMLKQEGFKVGEELTMKDAVTVLGTKLRQKNAEWARVREGLDALKQVSK